LRRRTADLARRQYNVLRQAEDGDPNDPFTQGLRQRYNDIQAERHLVLDEITALDTQDATEPRQASETDLTQLRIEIHYQTQEANLGDHTAQRPV
jgi:site-specific DNA recombinase